MNLDENISVELLTKEQKEKLTIWSSDLYTHAVVYPRKVFWRIHKNVPIIDSEKKPLVFKNFMDAYNLLRKIKGD